MSLTAHRILQYIALILIFTAMAGGYWYWKSQAAVRINQGLEDSLEQGLAGYWKLDDGSGTTATDSSTNGNNGTLTNGPTWTTGQILSGVDFDGTDDYITVSDSSTLDIGDTGDLTLTGWFNRDTFTTDDTIAAKRNGVAASDVGYIAYVDDATDKLVFEVSDGTDEYQLASTTTFTATGWNHFVIIWDQNSPANSEIYINGIANSATDTGTIGNVGTLSNAVGLNIGTESDAGNPFDGVLDEIRVYTRTLSIDEISRLYQIAAPTGVDTGLVGYWPFDGDDISGTTAYDRSGKGNNGTLTNGPEKVAGKSGQALNFWPNGADADSSVSMGDPASGALDFGSGDFSVGFWLKTSGYASQGSSSNTPLNKKSMGTPNSTGYAFTYTSANRPQFVIGNGTTDYYATGSVNIGDAAWHHWLGVRSGSMIYLYVDGLLAASNAVSGSASNSVGFVIGDYITSSSMTIKGSLDEVRIYNRALSAVEIMDLHQKGRSDSVGVSGAQDPFVLGLAGYWKLDDGSGTTATDASVNGNNGTLTNGPTWTTGQILSGVDFDGTDDYITVSDSSTLDIGDTGDLTLTGWFNRDTFTTDDTIAAKRNGVAASDVGYIAYVDDATDKLVFEVSDGTDEYQLASTTTFTATGWNHFVIIWNQNSPANSEIYINGIANSATDTGTIGNVGTLSNAVGLNIGTESDAGNPFDGVLDEIRVYTRTLSIDEISRLYQIAAPTGVDTGLVGYWPFDGDDISGTTAYDRSGKGNNGTLTGGPTIMAGRAGQTLFFDGADDAVEISSNFSNPSSLTVSMWFKTTYANGVLFSQTSGLPVSGVPSTYIPTLFITNSGLLRAEFWTGSVGGISTTQTVTDGLWHHVVFSGNATTQTLYLDSVLIGTRSGTMSYPTWTYSLFGTGYDSSSDGRGGSGTGWKYLNAAIDEPRVHNYVLSSGEVWGLYRKGLPDKVNANASILDGMAGYWKLDDGSGTTATDASVNGNNGTLTNGPTWTTGQILSGVDFDGTDDYITVSDSSTLDIGDTGDLTLTGWFNRDTFTTDDTIAAKRNGVAASDVGYIAYVDDATDKLVFEVSDGTDEYQLASTTTFTATGWNHFVIIWDQNSPANSEIYINGIANSATDTGTIGNVGTLSNAVGLNIGTESDAGNPFDGVLDEIRVYTRTLSIDEISRLYQIAAPTGVDTGLVGYWPFDGDDISGTTAYDRSGKGNNGTLTNGPSAIVGKIGQALSLDGVDDNIDVTNQGYSGEFSFSTWFYTSDNSQAGIIFGEDTGSGATASPKIGLTSGNFFVRIVDSGGSDTTVAIPDANQWHHLVVTRDSNNKIDLYVDGAGKRLFSDAAVSATYTLDRIAMNGLSADQNFSGKLDEVRIYNRALTAAEIWNLYNKGR